MTGRTSANTNESLNGALIGALKYLDLIAKEDKQQLDAQIECEGIRKPATDFDPFPGTSRWGVDEIRRAMRGLTPMELGYLLGVLPPKGERLSWLGRMMENPHYQIFVLMRFSECLTELAKKPDRVYTRLWKRLEFLCKNNNVRSTGSGKGRRYMINPGTQGSPRFPIDDIKSRIAETEWIDCTSNGLVTLVGLSKLAGGSDNRPKKRGRPKKTPPIQNPIQKAFWENPDEALLMEVTDYASHLGAILLWKYLARESEKRTKEEGVNHSDKRWNRFIGGLRSLLAEHGDELDQLQLKAKKWDILGDESDQFQFVSEDWDGLSDLSEFQRPVFFDKLNDLFDKEYRQHEFNFPLIVIDVNHMLRTSSFEDDSLFSSIAKYGEAPEFFERMDELLERSKFSRHIILDPTKKISRMNWDEMIKEHYPLILSSEKKDSDPRLRHKQVRKKPR